MKKVLVTGATGFLGEYLVKELVPHYTVYALGRNQAKKQSLEQLGAIFCHGDFTDKTSCEPFFQGIDFVIHAGALSTVWGKWDDFYQTNVKGTQLVAEFCLKHNIKRLIYVSSPSIYTEKQDRFDIHESDVNPENRLNFYIKSKIMAEKIVQDYVQKGLYSVVIRPRGLMGVGDTSLIPRVLGANKKIGIPLLRQGENIVDITCVENVAYALRLCLEAENINGDCFNITNGEPMEFRQILEKFLDSIGESPKYLKLPFPVLYGVSCIAEFFFRLFKIKGEPMLTKYTVCTLGFSQTLNIEKAKRKLGYTPIKSLSEGILDYGKWHCKNH